MLCNVGVRLRLCARPATAARARRYGCPRAPRYGCPRAPRAAMMRAVAVTRLITADDAPVLSELEQANREFLAPWSPRRSPAHYTVEGQRRAIADVLALYANGAALPHVILCDGVVVGRVTLSDIVGGVFCSCHLGYWLDQDHNGRGLATAAVAEVMGIAFGELGLHRIEAGTVPDNVRSRAVLERNGFVRFGYARAYLRIGGEWRDHVLYQALSEPPPDGALDGPAD